MTTTRNAVSWPPGRFALCHFEDVQAGYILCPTDWESAYLAGQRRTLPWVVATRSPTILNELAPGATKSTRQARVPARTPDGHLMYVAGPPQRYIRVIINNPA